MFRIGLKSRRLNSRIFGLANKLWRPLYRLSAGPEARSDMVPGHPEPVAAVRYFGRYRTGWIRDGVLLSVG